MSHEALPVQQEASMILLDPKCYELKSTLYNLFIKKVCQDSKVKAS